MATYLPSTDAGLLAWAQNFSALINANPTAYGLTLEEAGDYAPLVTAYADAYNTASNAGTRTTPAVQAKKTAKQDLIDATRPLVNTVQAYAGTTDQMRADLQITIRDSTYTPVPVPDSTPALSVVAVSGRTIKVNLRAREADGSPSEGRARPAGVKGAAVYFATGDDYPEDITGWTFKGNTSKTTFDVTIPDAVPAGSKVYLTAQWYNTKSQTGPACPPVETSIARGLSQAA